MRKSLQKPIIISLTIAVVLGVSAYTYYKVHVDDMPGYVFGSNWKFIPESKLPNCIPDPSELGKAGYMNPPCYESGEDVFF